MTTTRLPWQGWYRPTRRDRWRRFCAMASAELCEAELAALTHIAASNKAVRHVSEGEPPAGKATAKKVRKE